MILNLFRSRQVFNNARRGVLFVDSEYECWTIENAKLQIPEGEYKITIYPSPSLKREVPLLADVPGRTYIEIHAANYPDELRGCIAVGINRTNNYVLESRKAFDALMSKIRSATDIVYINIKQL